VSFLQNLFPANRVAAIATWLTGLAAFITGITNTLPTNWQDKAAMIAGIVTQLATALMFLWGAQKSEKLSTINVPLQTAAEQLEEILKSTPPVVTGLPQTAVTPDPEK
jgi:cytochrome c biogenesis protein CcdA